MMFFDWNPTDEDFQILGSWLKNRKLDSNYSHLSRIIFSKMNWRALPWDSSKYLAILIVETSVKFAPDLIAGNFLQDSVRQVSHLAHKLRKTPEQGNLQFHHFFLIYLVFTNFDFTKKIELFFLFFKYSQHGLGKCVVVYGSTDLIGMIKNLTRVTKMIMYCLLILIWMPFNWVKQ